MTLWPDHLPSGNQKRFLRDPVKQVHARDSIKNFSGVSVSNIAASSRSNSPFALGYTGGRHFRRMSPLQKKERKFFNRFLVDAAVHIVPRQAPSNLYRDVIEE
jgi:hypothetical protein